MNHITPKSAGKLDYFKTLIPKEVGLDFALSQRIDNSLTKVIFVQIMSPNHYHYTRCMHVT